MVILRIFYAGWWTQFRFIQDWTGPVKTGQDYSGMDRSSGDFPLRCLMDFIRQSHPLGPEKQCEFAILNIEIFQGHRSFPGSSSDNAVIQHSFKQFHPPPADETCKMADQFFQKKKRSTVVPLKISTRYFY
jgi:hypothetical protein